MRIICQTQDWWDTQEGFDQRVSGQFGLAKWLDRVEQLFSPVESCIASGTFSPVITRKLPKRVSTVTAGVTRTRPYDCEWWNYSLCAWEAGFYWAMNRNDWDLLVHVDTECLIGDVDFDYLLTEFMLCPEEVLSPQWSGNLIGGPFIAFKQSAVSKWLNGRLRPNLIVKENSFEKPMLPEEEMTRILKGVWWNYWGHIPTMRYDYPHEPSTPERRAEAMEWPFVRLPDPELTEAYLAKNCPLAKPVRPKPLAVETAQA